MTWGKVDPDKLPDSVTCYVDSTIALPLLAAYALTRREPLNGHSPDLEDEALAGYSAAARAALAALLALDARPEALPAARNGDSVREPPLAAKRQTAENPRERHRAPATGCHVAGTPRRR